MGKKIPNSPDYEKQKNSLPRNRKQISIKKLFEGMHCCVFIDGSHRECYVISKNNYKIFLEMKDNKRRMMIDLRNELDFKFYK